MKAKALPAEDGKTTNFSCEQHSLVVLIGYCLADLLEQLPHGLLI